MTVNVAAMGNNSKGQLCGGFQSALSDTPVAGVALGSNVKQVVASGEYTIALQGDGTVIGLGGSHMGELGVYDDLVIEPVKLALAGVKEVSAGGGHLIARLGDGRVATWAGSVYGTLGNGVTGKGNEQEQFNVRSKDPVYLTFASPVVEATAGGACCAVRCQDGSVWTWGENRKGQLGDGTTEEKARPVRVKLPSNVVKLSIGGEPTQPTHMLALLADGKCMAWGAGAAGQLCQGVTSTHKLPDSTVPIPVPLPFFAGVVGICAANSASYFILKGGTLVAGGTNFNYQLGVGALDQMFVTPKTVMRNVTAISTGWETAGAISGGTLYTWGKGNQGDLGNGSVEPCPTPTSIESLSEVFAVDGGSTHMVCLLHGSMAAPPVTITAGAGTLTIAWKQATTTKKWIAGIRPAGSGEQFVRHSLEPTARTATFTALTAGVNYEILLSNGDWGHRVLEGTPA